jgi:hypothetical protein
VGALSLVVADWMNTAGEAIVGLGVNGHLFIPGYGHVNS